MTENETVKRLLGSRSYLLLAVVSTHFPRWPRDLLSAKKKMIIILTIAETSIN
jgi:hypothetical protein